MGCTGQRYVWSCMCDVLNDSLTCVVHAVLHKQVITPATCAVCSDVHANAHTHTCSHVHAHAQVDESRVDH